MNKKGFTLVELLAVIAILAILVIIALPNVLNMFNSGKKSTFQTEVQEVFKTAQNQYFVNAMNGAQTLIYGTEGSCTHLEMSGTTALKYHIELDSTGGVTKLQAADDSYNFSWAGTESEPYLTIEKIGDDSHAIQDGSATIDGC